MRDYKELEVWKKSARLAVDIVKLTNNYDKIIPNALIFQIQKSAISIPSNIAEGIGRQYKKETIQFLTVARGSIFELETQLFVLTGLEIIDDKEIKFQIDNLKECLKLINGFINYYRTNTSLK